MFIARPEEAAFSTSAMHIRSSHTPFACNRASTAYTPTNNSKIVLHIVSTLIIQFMAIS
jgi:hypothetical protein